MNNIYTRPPIYHPRWITPQLQAAAEEHPVLVLTGARQVGKSTLLLNEKPFCDWRFYTMDDYDVLDQATHDPESLWAGTDRVVIDEVQKAPGVLPAVKKAVDHNPGKYQFILSASANLLRMKTVGESLAGRAVYFILDPMTVGEIEKRDKPNMLSLVLAGKWPEERQVQIPPSPDTLMLRGMMPALLPLSSPESWVRWWEGYVATYLERDLRQVSQIDALLDFRRLMELTALRSGQLLNQSELGRDARLTQPTVHRYLNILETTRLFERLPAYLASHRTRLLKSPKAFWNDPGLAVFLSGYYDTESLHAGREYGAYFETMVYHHLRVLVRLMVPSGRLYFWRRQDGVEVDFVIEYGRKLIGIEVKRTEKLCFGDLSGLQFFLDSHPEAVGGIVVYAGSEIRRMSENILAAPWTLLTG